MAKSKSRPTKPSQKVSSKPRKLKGDVAKSKLGSALSQASLVPKSSKAKGVSTSPLKIRKIGNSHGVVFPKEMLARLRASEGDEIAVTETETGLHLHRKDDEFEEHMKRVEEIMARYPNTLRALAK
ncbi:MAG: hypothetical protein AB7F91_14845 [Parvularculaceae bacterium]